MEEESRKAEATEDLRCPECSAVLKKRRSRRADACEMLCGVCGRPFDVCDPETKDRLKS